MQGTSSITEASTTVLMATQGRPVELRYSTTVDQRVVAVGHGGTELGELLIRVLLAIDDLDFITEFFCLGLHGLLQRRTVGRGVIGAGHEDLALRKGAGSDHDQYQGQYQGFLHG